MQGMQETWVLSLGREDPLEEGMETHSNILAWRIPWTEDPGGLQSMGLNTTEQLNNNNVMYYSALYYIIYLIKIIHEKKTETNCKD